MIGNNKTWKIGMFYAIFGPLIAYFSILIILIIGLVIDQVSKDQIDILSLLHMFLIFAAFGIVVAYVVGLVPALITGLLVGYFSDQNEWFSAGVIGMLMTMPLAILIYKDFYPAVAAFTCIGGVTGVLCACLRQRRIKLRA